MRNEAGVPGVVGSAALLVVVRFSLKLAGLARTRRVLERLARWGGRGAAESGGVDRTVREVAVAAAFVPVRAECLEQSLVLYLRLLCQGQPVCLRLGVQPFPFLAHAWVEHGGVPLNEELEFVRRFLPLPEPGR